MESTLNVLHLHRADYTGHESSLMHRLHEGLRAEGVNSGILCRVKSTDSPSVHVLRDPCVYERLLDKVARRAGLNDIAYLNANHVLKNRHFQRSDVIHLHGLERFVSYMSIPRLSREKPTVFTIYDNWPLSGHCTFSFDCERWKTGCGNCPYPDVHPAIRRDATRIEWKLKRLAYEKSRLHLIVPGKWQVQRLRQSMLKRFPVHHIPFGVDCELFKPADRGTCRALLGIPPGKFVISVPAAVPGWGAAGGDLLRIALNGLPESVKSGLVALFLGKSGEGVGEDLGISVIPIGVAGSNALKPLCYSAADIMVAPARASFTTQIVLESMACGVPAVAFNTQSMTEVIDDGITGLLAPRERAPELRDAVLRLIEDSDLRASVGTAARKVVVEKFNMESHVRQHVDLYVKMIAGGVCVGEGMT